MTTSRMVLALVVLAVAASGVGGDPQGSVGDTEAAGLQIDHVIVGVPDLDQGIAQLEKLTGVRPVFGGEHPGRGTHNALLALGPRVYLELLAAQAGADLGDAAAPLRGLTGPTPLGFAVSTTDATGTTKRLRDAGFDTTEPAEGSRLKPDGSKLEWVTFGIVEPQLDGAPFFIQWSETSPHPADTSPAGCTLSAVRLTDPKAESLQQLMDTLQLNVEVRSGAQFRAQLVLHCPTGEIVLGQ